MTITRCTPEEPCSMRNPLHLLAWGECFVLADHTITLEMRDNPLARALTAQHRKLYRTSPSFFAAVNTLAEMLPLMVDGLAASSEAQDEAMKSAYIESLLHHPLLTQAVDARTD